MYNDLSRYLSSEFPSLRGNIEGEYYPAPEPAATLSQITQALQLAMMPVLLLGEGLFTSVGISVPAWFVENKMAVFFIVYIANVVAQNKASTGAFEIEFNGKLVYSKLAEGRVPTLDVVLNALRRYGLEG